MKPMIPLAALALAACAPTAAPQSVEAPPPLSGDWAAWNAPVAPFRIVGDLHYVGARNVAAYAVRTPEGIILIDTGFVQTVPQIAANLKTLGMDIADVKFLLNSHAHTDHAGGFAAIKAQTRARIVMSQADATLLAAGGRGDFAWGDDLAFPRATADRIVAHGDKVELGGTVLTAHITPGHTKGCTTWTLRAGAANVVFLCGTSAPGYDLVDNAAYPDIVADYLASFARMASLPCDIALPGHAEAIVATVSTKGADALVDPAGCKATIAAARAAFEKELARQQAGGAPD